MRSKETVEGFAKFVWELVKSDRDAIIATAGMTGEGKSTFMILLQIAYAAISKTRWDFNHLTWQRSELLEWIDGDKKGKGKMPEYSAVLGDELISLFYRRNWYEDPQKEAIELLNKCRDRHLFIGGNIPNFWDLDSSYQSRVRFYVYIPRGRSRAWVFEHDDNPFASDKWNRTENKKHCRKNKKPYKCANFVCEIEFPDLTPEQKKLYLGIRNTKRVKTELQSKKDKIEKYGKIKKERDLLIRHIFKTNPKLKLRDVADMLEGTLSIEGIRLIKYGEM